LQANPHKIGICGIFRSEKRWIFHPFSTIKLYFLMNTGKGLNTLNIGVSALNFMPVFAFRIWYFSCTSLIRFAEVYFFEDGKMQVDVVK
jgi:hypothetical protein